ncbi:carboxylesterase/lipase family protein [Polyangium jinanense]|uniref:Carboxylic ester hydrolase n=1 Tax=Polyangium jinanense TaxID=2829994 RepID=A0A9X4B021_9BACT|nr:carboxylesterase family protein [Polyangium jinanense]MDC3962202.1 carboxylesterase family protein [Polyangium jinanense]MDC3988747.1 carboxylesterase family protein [Polyangium jinanense]
MKIGKRRSTWALLVPLAAALVACSGGGSGSGSGGSGSGGSGGGGSGGSGGSGGDSARCVVETPSEPGIVATDSGLVRGNLEGASWVYRGIPYAAPPTGDLRWKPPELAACWDGVRDASAFGAQCPQIDEKTKTAIGDEDCLSLNVWAPDGAADSAPLPVLFFVHGGGNIQGSSSETLPGGALIYNGQDLAESQKAVVVTINYRLGALGFLALPELAAETPNAASGNYGLQDQIAALKWVQKNIAAFGGDPKRVLLFGESAGALNTLTLMASPLAKGLFSAALAESGGTTSTPKQEAEAAMSERVAESSCGSAADKLACLRGKTAAELLAELPGSIGIGSVSVGSDASKYGPVIDGYVLPKATLATFSAGEHNRVPLVIGTNGDELAKGMAIQVSTLQQYENVVTQSFGPLAPQVLAAYPAGDYPTPQDALVALYSDLRFNCPNRSIARAVAGSQSEPVYRYFFTRRAKTAQGENPAAHAVELLYVFRTLTDIPLYSPVAEDLTLADAMMGYWGRFGATGDPNGSGAAPWPPYDAQKDTHIVLDAPISSGEGVRKAQCDAWEQIAGMP